MGRRSKQDVEDGLCKNGHFWEESRKLHRGYWVCGACRRKDHRRYTLLSKHGVTPEWVDSHPACDICGREVSGRGRHVDHDHETGEVRGVLCLNCNLALGHFNDSIENLARAIEYLERSKE